MGYKLGFLYFTIVLSFGSCSSSRSNSQSAPHLKAFQFSQLKELISEQERPVIVFLHAKWCHFCRNMEETTLRNPDVIQTLNNDYYFISFDGEQKDGMSFRNKSFRYRPSGRNTGTHELAIELGTIDGNLTYPSLVILNSDFEITFQHNSFLNAEQMIRVIKNQ